LTTNRCGYLSACNFPTNFNCGLNRSSLNPRRHHHSSHQARFGKTGNWDFGKLKGAAHSKLVSTTSLTREGWS